MSSSEPELHKENIDTKTINELIANLQCPVCFQTCDPPLMSCVNGHFTCKTCLDRISADNIKWKFCPQCREQGFFRNLPYEKIATKLLSETKLECHYFSGDNGGCQGYYKFGGLLEHLVICPGLTKKYNCPCTKCFETELYSLPELIKHLIINLGFNMDTEYRLNFIPSLAVGPLTELIGSEIVKLEKTESGRNLGIRPNANECVCSYSTSPIINYELKADAYENYNNCIIYPPYDFFNNFKKEDNLLAINTNSSPDRIATNLTFLIDTAQIYLIRTTCSLASDMVLCDATYLNSLYINENDPHLLRGIILKYNYNKKYSTVDTTSDTPENTKAAEPERKKHKHNLLENINYFDSKYYSFQKYKPEMAEEVLFGASIERRTNTSKREALVSVKWQLVL